MDTIISIVTVCVTLLLGVAGFIFNSFVQRKNNSINVITKTRLARREKTKTLMAKLIKLSSVKYLDTLSKEEHKEVINSLVGASSDIRSEYSRTFSNDRKLLDVTDELCDSVTLYLKSGNDSNKEMLMNKRHSFVKEMDLYIQTEWARIKNETAGKQKRKNRRNEWEELYKEFEDKYDTDLTK